MILNLPAFGWNQSRWVRTALVLMVSLTAWTARCEAAVLDEVPARIEASASSAEKALRDTSKTVQDTMAEVWQRVDESRLHNRTPDQLVAWIIMGLLVGGLVRQFTRLKTPVALLTGLAGAFLGGIAANIAGLDLGLGPVLIRYEELLASLAGGLMILFCARWLTARRKERSQG